MKEKQRLKQMNLIKEYLEKYAKYYDEYELDYLRDNLDISPSSKDIPDVLRQIFSELNLFEDDDNAYLQFASLIENSFGLDKNIVEVGGGVIPSLAKIIALKQEKGTITVYDPRLIENNSNYSNLTLKKEMFNLNTFLPNVELYVGFMPRNATEIIINKACRENKDFIVTLCGDGFVDEDGYYEDIDEFLHSVIYTAERKIEQNNLGVLKKTYLQSLGKNYPVIYNKRL